MTIYKQIKNKLYWKQIQAMYPNQWVIMTNCLFSGSDLIGGRVECVCNNNNIRDTLSKFIKNDKKFLCKPTGDVYITDMPDGLDEFLDSIGIEPINIGKYYSPVDLLEMWEEESKEKEKYKGKAYNYEKIKEMLLDCKIVTSEYRTPTQRKWDKIEYCYCDKGE